MPLLVIVMLLPASAQAATADLAISKADSPDPVAVIRSRRYIAALVLAA